MPGHIGIIYQASNALCLGRSSPRTHWVLPDGQVLSPRALQKVRAAEPGHEYAAAQLIAAGALRRGPARNHRRGWPWRSPHPVPAACAIPAASGTRSGWGRPGASEPPSR
jgi:hypothetical protein